VVHLEVDGTADPASTAMASCRRGDMKMIEELREEGGMINSNDRAAVAPGGLRRGVFRHGFRIDRVVIDVDRTEVSEGAMVEIQ
jgi:hypothetical protein